MAMNSIDLKLPELDCVQLKCLHQGDVFMLAKKDDFYQPYTKVFMVLPIKPFERNRACVSLLDGSVTSFKEQEKVVRLSATIQCNYWNSVDDGLPF